MYTPAKHVLCSQLADDLSWLEDHCRRQPDLAAESGKLRLAGSLVRNVLGPALEKQPVPPLHIAVVGGAGAGKSTIVNFLCGSVAAEANPQAGFTRHPVGYMAADAGFPEPNSILHPLRRLTHPTPSSLDEDVFQIRRVPASGGLLKSFIVWDCPDMTTWAATGYVPRLLEVCGLADIIVYVASDERYNDEVPTEFLHLLMAIGKPVIVVLTKMREPDAATLVSHFTSEVLSRLPDRSAAVLAVPHLTPVELADPVKNASRYRIPILNQVMVLASQPSETRQRIVRTALNHLATGSEGLLAVARNDLAALEAWRNAVAAGRAEFDARYYREYLSGERFPRFDEAMVRLLDLLEVPGVGRVVSGALYVLRTPYRLVKSWVGKALARPAGSLQPELPVLERGLTGWLDGLRAESLRRADSHPLWNLIRKGFESTLTSGIQGRFDDCLRSLQTAQVAEVDRISRDIYADLEQHPARLNSLRGGKLLLDLSGIGSAVALGGINVWDLVWVPLAASATQMLVEFFGKQYVDAQREQARKRQQLLAEQHVSGPLADWLAAWPTTGGSSFERLQQVLHRIPDNIQKIERVFHGMEGQP
jgi:hypothetical protein